MIEPFEEKMRRGGDAAVREACRFLSKADPVHDALRRITRRLAEHNLPYAVSGGMALVAHGHNQSTAEVEIIVTAQVMSEIHARLSDADYVRCGENAMRDTSNGVRINFRTAGKHPEDGQATPIIFPNPETCSVEINGIHYVGLNTFIELKLCAGMSGVLRIRDLSDIQELIRARNLSAEFAQQLHPYVREKYMELWQAIQQDTSREE